jgi:uncharacterized protein YbbC (DUF1343 family)
MSTSPTCQRSKVISGLDRLLNEPPGDISNARLGLLCNQAVLTRDYAPAPESLARAMPDALTTLFSPQHGFYGEKQDNMVESNHSEHPRLGLPVYSLYGDTRRPTREMFRDIDILLIDLWDLGCRVYTFFSTVTACLEEAAAAGVKVVILDRPNPLGRGEEGPILPPELFSFVGPFEMPLRHGQSLGELCLMFAKERSLDLDLRVIRARGWQGQGFWLTGLNWVMPSPNMPWLTTALVYPGQVLLEGTSLSEGRGTTRPFEIFGAPGLDPWAVLGKIEQEALTGCVLQPYFFEPTFHKHAGKVCGGFIIHITQRRALKPLRLTLAVLSAISRAQPGMWSLRQPPYEYEYERRPLDLLLGDPSAVDGLLNGEPVGEMEADWRPGLLTWRERCAPFNLYL